MKVEFVPNVGADGMLEVHGISKERHDQMINKMRELAEKLFNDESYQYDEYLRDMLAISESDGEFAFLAFQSGRKVEEHQRAGNNPLMAILKR